MKNDNKQKLNINDFFKLPVKEREKLMSQVAGEANQDQKDLLKKHEQQFCREKAGNAV